MDKIKENLAGAIWGAVYAVAVLVAAGYFVGFFDGKGLMDVIWFAVLGFLFFGAACLLVGTANALLHRSADGDDSVK